jgi:hypothetical protein
MVTQTEREYRWVALDEPINHDTAASRVVKLLRSWNFSEDELQLFPETAVYLDTPDLELNKQCAQYAIRFNLHPLVATAGLVLKQPVRESNDSSIRSEIFDLLPAAMLSEASVTESAGDAPSAVAQLLNGELSDLVPVGMIKQQRRKAILRTETIQLGLSVDMCSWTGGHPGFPKSASALFIEVEQISGGNLSFVELESIRDSIDRSTYFRRIDTSKLEFFHHLSMLDQGKLR